VTDVLVIGAGASGGVVSRRLAEAGFGVVCLEQGDWPDRAGFRGTEPDWELAIRGKWSSSPNVRRNPGDSDLDLHDSDMLVGNFNGVGGGTVIFAGVWPRLLPGDFQARSTAGVADDWPLGYDELAPHYDETDRQFGVSGLGGNPAYPPGPDPPLPPLPIGRAGLHLARAHARLGWHWWPETNAILSAPYDGRHACVQRGTCGAGCSEGAKASTDLTHWPRAIAAGAQLLTGARVARITVDRAGRATGAEWIDRDGATHFTAADVVLCAASGVGTARLLLLSAAPSAPDGLANSSGLVGRRLMLHPGALVTGYFDDDLRSWQGQAGGLIQSLEFSGTDTRRGFAGGSRWSLMPAGGPVRVALSAAGRAVLGAEHHDHMRARFGRGAQWVLLCEDLPSADNRVELSTTAVDDSGLPIAKVVYAIADTTRDCIAFNVARATESLHEAGASIVDVARMGGNSHQLGTARMGDDPATSVVDRWCMTHDVANLGIVDGSVFVTAGAANPTSTISALALRAVDHLIEIRTDVRPPIRPRSFAAPRPPLQPIDLVARPQRHLAAEQRERLAALADALIPADERMPSAGGVGIAHDLVDWVLDVRPDLADALERALAEPVPDAAARLDVLRRSDRAAYYDLVLAVVAGYYHSSVVRGLIGYPGQEARPVRGFDFPEYVGEGLLEFMLTEGPVP
jgi:choline dehydrogenase-like flavoprotein